MINPGSHVKEVSMGLTSPHAFKRTYGDQKVCVLQRISPGRHQMKKETGMLGRDPLKIV